ncbi:MAG: hypothetical protein ABS99_09735 [Acetobacteraceae bacterium SCN 69-10]|nr:MAG: hypothetical protein ABS99_09735 [Acetobacteraceae bacterium SCN 69-10]
MDFPHAPEADRAGLRALAAADPAGSLPWRRRPGGFPGLLQAIVGQQISNQAAAAIWRRLHALPGALSPPELLKLDDEALRGAGLSRPKVAHARALAAAFAEGRLDEAALAEMPDEAAIAAISAVRGMGRWSAEVYLLFALGRMDVFPAGDIALAGAAADLKRLPARPGPDALRALAEDWRPWRALAARLLWHHWRHLTGRPAMDDLPVVGG